MQNVDGQTLDTASAFDDWASHWSSHYRSSGTMADRITRFSKALSCLDNTPAEILDYGCGTGEITRAISTHEGWQLTGCDLSGEMISKARAVDPEQDLTWVQIDAAQPVPLPFNDAQFDAIYSSSVFEYLADPKAVIQDSQRILKPGGWLMFTIPDPRHPIRKKEALKAKFARFAPFWALIKRTRWRSEFLYLRISVNRPFVGEWLEILKTEGFKVSVPESCSDPLALVVVQKAIALNDHAEWR